jgi:hypothetical protein
MAETGDGEGKAKTYPGGIAKPSVSSTGHHVHDKEAT